MVGMAGGWCGSKNRFLMVPSSIAFWFDMFVPVYVLHCIIRRWKNRLVSRQLRSSTSARSCGWVLRQNKLEMQWYASRAHVESELWAVRRGMGLGFCSMWTKFLLPQVG
jgi:hypothetical protein